MTIQDYVNNISRRYSTGISREHSYRGDLQTLLESMLTGVLVTNEPARYEFGAPDYILTKRDVPVGFIEAKDIGDRDLEGVKKSGNKEQFDRYKASLENIIFTDYLEFLLYRDGQLVSSIRIAEIKNGRIIAKPENFDDFESFIQSFVVHTSQPIRSAKKLAELMAGKARLLYDVLEKALSSDEQNNLNSTLKDQLHAFKQVLIHDITPGGFADIYAQTIAYGMFAARLHDNSLETFSRQEAAELIPKSNPFLRRLFGYIAGPEIDDRIKWIVDNLAHIFLATDIRKILKNYGKSTKMEDPIIHFYETFLSEYDSKIRKARGVWYTPQPVVSFIVKAVDDILKTEFNLPQGLADTSKTTIKLNTQTADKRTSTGYKQTEREVHKVQILDPATGTGTFLAEAVKQIYKGFEGQEGLWSDYVDKHLLPRLNGFELLMASYAMAHLQLNLLLTEKGYTPKTDQRLRVYLTNSLEEYHKDTDTLFANWLSAEANEANRIKRDTPVMCIIGNPPYSGESANKGKWIMDLMENYKKEPGGKIRLNERNSKVINDDYVKFLRYGQDYIEKNGSGILAFINPHNYLDSPTFRGMRWNLLKTYDKIFTIDLHGNSLKGETMPDGGKDENVFDIRQGVTINIFVKTGKKKTNELGEVFHYDLYGKRQEKYNFLSSNSIGEVPFKKVEIRSPMYFMKPIDYEGIEEYEKGFNIIDLFNISVSGIKTHRDAFVIDYEKETLYNRIKNFFLLPKDQILSTYNVKENKTWKIEEVQLKAKQFNKENITFVNYRPFDNRFIYYSTYFIDRARVDVMENLINKNNIGLVLNKPAQGGPDLFTDIFITKYVTDQSVFSAMKRSPFICPLYIYPSASAQSSMEKNHRTPNLNMELVKKMSDKISMIFTSEKEDPENTFAPIDILDYVYAILHSPMYREKYNEFLKSDFPKIPYPKNRSVFIKLVELGKQLREIHLLESPVLNNYITNYPIGGSNKVTRKLTKTSIGYEPLNDIKGRVWINDEQYFDNVPLVAWEFYIGGYYPAEKWLKDRRDRELSFDDILHYQKIIVALVETDRLMKEIDKIEGVF